jgi:2-polyprenyl-3-methyl-5-hydroxy-6-metoxy-1,4-benzoquinol methylase
MLNRKFCIICTNNKFVPSFSIINTLNIVSEKLIEPEFEKENINLEFIGCEKCGCVQLRNLIDPNELYSQASHYTRSDVWNRHNLLFSEFILNNNNKCLNNILEIGGGGGVLANQIKVKNPYIKNYQILDIETSYIDTVNNIEYIKGNCEEFDLNTIYSDTIIFSHMFEHLYNPIKFINKLNETHNIKNIYISNPHMVKCIENNDFNCLSIQHTYFIDNNYMEYLFNRGGFVLKNSYNFEDNSIFYHFSKVGNNDLVNTCIDNYKNVELINYLKNFYENLKKKIYDIDINKPFFISPSGYYGQIFYNNLNDSTKKNLVGFLDSDDNKINKRLSGTPCKIFSKKYISNLKNPTVLIISEKYKNEINDELLTINKNVHIIIC